ncbi:MAG: DNA translocase FtsK 4TM domain-containing protein [Paraburkholderia tropica]
MSTVEEQKSEKMRFRDWPWPVIAPVFGLLLLGIAYSLGDAYYSAFLGGFWIESSAFPIDKSRHLVLSLWGAFKGSIGLGAWLSENSRQLLGLVFILLMYVVVSFIFDLLHRRLRAWAHRRRENKPSHRKIDPLVARYLNIMLAVLFTVCGVITLSWSGPQVLAIPSNMGEAVGENVAAEFKRDLDRGCGKSVERCQILVKDGQEVARGYVIAQSATRVALYYNGNTRQIPIDGIEIRTADRALPR